MDTRRLRSTRFRRTVVAASCLSLLLTGAVIGSSTGTATTAVAAKPVAIDSYASSAVLPFTKPSTATLRASSKKVFANWVTTAPVSIDNLATESDYYARNYLNPDGEGGVHASYGGFMRDRPLGRPIRTGDWRLEDMKTEVRQAISAGIDGFTMVIYGLPGTPTATTLQTWNNARTMMQAAAAVDPGFKIIPMPDMTTLGATTVEELARHMAYLATFPSIYRTSDGRAMFSPFNTEKRTAVWWSSWLTSMTTTHRTPAALWPTFLNETANQDAFAPFVDGIAAWGTRSPDSSKTTWDYMSPKDRIRRIHALGEKFMAPVSMQDSRPRSGKFWEALNTQNLRNTWDIAIDGKADWVQLITWNDISEGSGMQPSMSHGWSLLDLNAYYISWFKTGTAPVVNKDAIYLTHREHWVADRPTYPKQTLLSYVTGSTPARDGIEALVFLTAPATVTIRAGSTSFSCAAPAGVSKCVAPLAAGTVSATVVRSGATRASVTSPWTVSHTPYVTDHQYVSVSSLREGAGTVVSPTPTPTPTPTPAPAPTTTSSVTVRPVMDTYVDEWAPTMNFATSSQVVARGSKGATSYLQFALPPAPAGKTLKTATLVMRTCTATESGAVNSVPVTVIGGAWAEGTVTWNTRPALTSTLVGSFPAGTRPDTVYRVALSPGVLASAQGKQLGLALTSSSTDNLRLWSTAHPSPDVQPQLVLTYG